MKKLLLFSVASLFATSCSMGNQTKSLQKIAQEVKEVLENKVQEEINISPKGVVVKEPQSSGSSSSSNQTTTPTPKPKVVTPDQPKEEPKKITPVKPQEKAKKLTLAKIKKPKVEKPKEDIDSSWTIVRNKFTFSYEPNEYSVLKTVPEGRKYLEDFVDHFLKRVTKWLSYNPRNWDVKKVKVAEFPLIDGEDWSISDSSMTWKKELFFRPNPNKNWKELIDWYFDILEKKY